MMASKGVSRIRTNTLLEVKNLIIDNYILILFCAIIFEILRYIARRVKIELIVRTNDFNDKKTNKIINFLKNNLIILIMASVVIAQYKYNFVLEIEKTQSLMLFISILTLYGIFLSFIQFLFGFSAQNNNDNYWGESKVRFLLTRSTEYKLFNSLYFKIMIIYIGTYTLLNENIINELRFIGGSEILLNDVYFISIANVMVIYVMIFLKSMDIKRELIYIEEKHDILIKLNIENKIKKNFRYLFSEQYNGRFNYFNEVLFDRIKKVEESEKSRVLKVILSDIYIYWKNHLNENRRYWFRNFSLVMLFINQNDMSNVYKVRNECAKFWSSDLLNHVNLTFIEMLYIYKLQNELLFTEYIRNSNKKKEEVIINYKLLYNKINSNNEANAYNFPDQIWENISNITDIQELLRYSEEIPLIKHLNDIQIDLLNSDDNCQYNEELLSNYYDFVTRLLRVIHKKNLYDAYKIFKVNSFREVKNRGNENIINNYICRENIRIKAILEFMISLKNTDEDKKFIHKLCEILDFKDVLFWITYMLLSKDEKWGSEVKFFKDIISSKCDSLIKIPEDVIEHIINRIENTYLGHRFKPSLIRWIYVNYNKMITSKLIKESLNERNFDFVKFLKFRYVINSPEYCRINLSKLTSNYNLNNKFDFNQLGDIILDITSNKILVNIDYFHGYVLNTVLYCFKNNIPEVILQSNNVESYLIGFKNIPITKLIKKIINDKNIYIGNGIFDFVVLNLYEKDFTELLDDSNIRDFVIEGIEKSLCYHDLSLRDYVNLITSIAKEYGFFIPEYRKEIIYICLEELIIC